MNAVNQCFYPLRIDESGRLHPSRKTKRIFIVNRIILTIIFWLNLFDEMGIETINSYIQKVRENPY